MPIRLTPREKKVAQQLSEIKRSSGSHSPSPAMLAGIKGVAVKHDFCYLSNPHATELFLRYFRKDFRNEERLRRVVEYYPSQNRALAEKIAAFLAATQKTHSLSVSPSKEGERIQAENIFVGNGATEIIQAALQNFTKKRILVPVPTFSPYLEFASKDVSVIQHQLRKKDDFRLNRAELLTQVRKEEPDTVVLINPNNPDGGYIEVEDVHGLLTQLRHVPTVIVDESFAHFVAQKIGHATSLVQKFPNLVVIKSLSKDFGIAGVRLGYAVMSAANGSSSAPQSAPTARTAATCWALRPGDSRPARMFVILSEDSMIAESATAVRSTWPPPSPTEPSIETTRADLWPGGLWGAV